MNFLRGSSRVQDVDDTGYVLDHANVQIIKVPEVLESHVRVSGL